MMHDRVTIPGTGRRSAGLAARLAWVLAPASAAVLLAGAAGWWTLLAIRHKIEAAPQAADGDAAAVAAELLTLADAIGAGLAAGVFLVLVLLAGLYFYLARAVVLPLKTNAELLGRLSAGDGREDVPASQLARNDEIGDLSRATRNVLIHWREEMAIAKGMSVGDFTGAVAARESSGAFGLAIRRLAEATIDTLGRVNAYAGEVMADCEAIAAASGKLSANSSVISAAATEISTGIAQIKTHADDNAGAVERAGTLVVAGCQSVERGYEDIGEMGAVMLNMQACGDKIVRIAKSIGDIAFQTNLLALNASVEAARAGRNGKGFTIVAGEVRSLAVRTRQAAEETSTLMKETVEQVELAAAIAGRINAVFSEMQDSIQQADALLEKIGVASREQSGGIDQISATLRRVDKSARENVNHSGDIAENTGGMSRRTEALHRSLGSFRLDFRRTPAPDLYGGAEAAAPPARLPHAIGRAERE